MTGKADYTSEEWEKILEGPPSAGLLVIMAQKGGTFRETISMAKAYTEARQQHGQSELLDAIVSAKPEIDHTRYRSPEELTERSVGHIRDAVALLATKASAQELEGYKSFVVHLAEKVAAAHREGGRDEDPVSDAERAAVAEVVTALG